MKVKTFVVACESLACEFYGQWYVACLKPGTSYLVRIFWINLKQWHKYLSKCLRNNRGLINLIKFDLVEKNSRQQRYLHGRYSEPNLHDFVANSDCHSKDNQWRCIYRKFIKFRLLQSQNVQSKEGRPMRRTISIHCFFSF